MLACLIISGCLLAAAAALDSTTATLAAATAASTASSSVTSGCLGFECRRRRAFEAVGVFMSRPERAEAVAPSPQDEGASRQTAAPAPHDDKRTREPKRVRLAGLATTKLVRTAEGVRHRAQDEPAHDKQVLHENASRMTEELRKDVDDDEEDVDGVLPAEKGHGVEEGRARNRQTKLGKKVDGTVLHMLLMLKMMPLMFMSTKVAVLSFLVQLKSFVLTTVSVAIAAVQFFWRLQEKRQRGNAALALQTSAAPGWEEGNAVWPDRRKYISF